MLAIAWPSLGHGETEPAEDEANAGSVLVAGQERPGRARDPRLRRAGAIPLRERLKAYRRDPTGRSGTTLGGALDLRVTWTLWRHVELMGGYGRFLPDAFVKSTGPAAPANWFSSSPRIPGKPGFAPLSRLTDHVAKLHQGRGH